MRIAVFAAAAAWVMGAAACGDDGPEPNQPIGIATLPLAFAEVGCARLVACTDPAIDDDADLAIMARVDGMSCAQVLAEGQVLFDPVQVEAGIVQYDPVKAAQCLAEWRQSPCTTRFEAIAACREMMTGTIVAGDACSNDFMCAGDSVCAPIAGELDCPSVCKPRVALGGACRLHQECSNVAGPSMCQPSSRICVRVAEVEKVVGVGEICGWDYDGSEGQTTLNRCGPGLACVAGAADGVNRCLTVVAVGGACDDSNICELGAFCAAEAGGGKCRAVTVANNVNEVCRNEATDAGAADIMCNEFKGLECNGTVCVQAGGRAGAPCTAAEGGCLPGYYCSITGDAETGTCAAVGHHGAACTENRGCHSGYCGEDGRCGQETACD